MSELIFFIEPDKIEKNFPFISKMTPFSLKSDLKTMMKNDHFFDEKEFIIHLVNELNTVCKHIKTSDIIYHNNDNYKICILKFRMADYKNNKGKSCGWRIISLIDYDNSIFILLSIYMHAKGKNDLTPNENKKVRELCDEYANSI